MLLSHSEKAVILSEFPNIKLSYENITHKKVYNSDIILAIPEGRKCFAWFTTYNDKNVCLIMELAENNQINSIKIVNVCFQKELSYGTILYGTTFYYSHNIFFTIEDIFYYKGKNVSRDTWGNKFELFEKLMSETIKQLSLNNSFVVFGLPVFSNNLDDFTRKLENIKYRLETIQFRSFKRANNFQYMSYRSFLIKDKDKDKFAGPVKPNYQNSVPNDRFKTTRPVSHNENKKKREVVFRVKPDIVNDIYHLYVNDMNETTYIYYDVAYIPDFTTSVMMNRLFRNIKENQNLDALEESDDEEEFENEKEDRFVNLEKHYNMVCLYNYKFKKWYPTHLAGNNTRISTQNELS